MRVIGWTVVSLSLLGCQEYNLGEPPPNFEGPNPPGLENPVVQDRIVQVPIPSVDVLWIIDNSGSMLQEQKDLRENFPAFMEYFLGSGLDYHIGVVSTDMDANNESGKLVAASNGERYITTDSEDPMGMFESMADLGILGSSDERGREAAYTALELEADATNAGFLRDDRSSGIHMTVVTDEPDLSRNSRITKEEFAEWANGLRPSDPLVTFNSICLPPDVFYYGGDDYVYLSLEVGGIMHDVRVDDWVNVLEALGIQAAGLHREYFLSQLPVEGTVEVKVVTVDGTTIPFDEGAWTYSSSRNSITFDEFLPDPLSTVVIDYTALSSMIGVSDAE